MPTLVEQNDFPLSTQLVYKDLPLTDFMVKAREEKCLVTYQLHPHLNVLYYVAIKPDGQLLGSWHNIGFSTLWVRKEAV